MRNNNSNVWFSPKLQLLQFFQKQSKIDQIDTLISESLFKTSIGHN